MRQNKGEREDKKETFEQQDELLMYSNLGAISKENNITCRHSTEVSAYFQMECESLRAWIMLTLGSPIPFGDERLSSLLGELMFLLGGIFYIYSIDRNRLLKLSKGLHLPHIQLVQEMERTYCDFTQLCDLFLYRIEFAATVMIEPVKQVGISSIYNF
ncbi:hypothetical protein HNY73_015073 [Argiope bruennichi]|uniref:Uncharacterized protein n=1 Tax=Argiope bruennichi TaxID=94029 RepID=A0A8T0EQZ7_ARGBR|nr:hypothetical protein HNY73_015073 [Argiope bruennichi]